MSYSYAASTRTTADEVVVHPAMSFRAILAGWLVASGMAGLLYVAGLALGFSSFDAWDAASSAKSIGIGSAVWLVLTWAAALLLGGLFASWFDGHDDQTRGALHGVTVWGLSVAATGLWLALGLAHAMHGQAGGPANHDGPGDSGMLRVGAMASDGGAIAILDADVAGFFLDSHDPYGHDRAASAPIVAALIAGHDDIASNLLAADTRTKPDEAAQALQRLSPLVAAARAQAKQAADRAAHYTALTLWIIFASSFLALLTAALGGWLGAGHIHRVYHLREYPARTTR